MIFSEVSLSSVLSVVVMLLTAVLYWYQRKVFRYWKDRGVQYIEPTWFFGSVRDEVLRLRTWGSFVDKCYNTFKEKGFGGVFIFGMPTLFVCDPVLIERILVQDFIHFHDRWSVGSHEILIKNLMYESGEKWRLMRYKLGQAFTTKKIKGMFEQIFKSGDYVMKKIDKITKSNEPVKIESLVFVYVTEALSSCTFGLQLASDSNQRESIKQIVSQIHDNSPARLIFVLLAHIYPKLYSFFKIRAFPKSMTRFFMDLTRGAIMYRDLNQVKRNDFLQMVLSLKDQEEKGMSMFNNPPDLTEEDTILNQVRNISHKQKHPTPENIFTEECIASLMLNFIQAGLKSSVVTISFALFEIAKNQEIQNRVYDEIDQTISKHKGWSFEAIREMTYLDSIIQETLRRWGINLVLIRKVTETYRLKGTDITLDEGVLVHILLSSLHMDPLHFPDPEVFIPERFTESSYKPSSTFMPFGQGPRICIGIRLAVTMMKVCIARLLSEYQLEVSDRMTLPLELDPLVYYPKVVGGTWLTFKKRA